MAYCMEAAAQHKLKYSVLDRINPINGMQVAGPVNDAEYESFVAYHPMPVRHGMTHGELARWFNSARKINADLEVVQLRGWRRDMWFDPETGNYNSLSGTTDLEWCTRVIEGGYLAKAGWKAIAKKKYPFLVDTTLFCKHINPDGEQFP
jgi:hypothetical protein